MNLKVGMSVFAPEYVDLGPFYHVRKGNWKIIEIFDCGSIRLNCYNEDDTGSVYSSETFKKHFKVITKINPNFKSYVEKELLI